MPHFKASLNEGNVTVAEVGLVKTEIAYHGEVLHVGARVLSLCNELKAGLLITSNVFDKISGSASYNFETVESVGLRGKVLM